ncbi:MAG: HEAT repeat domain-containing protein [Anaerolineaceae bacterium]|nr:MAG: HEAT repeat domain-containing protein [Anaerolineaceae bacterium]
MSDLTLDDYIALLATGTPAERRNAAWMLGRQRDARIIQPLIAALKDDDDDARLRAVEALGNIKDGDIVPHLITALGEDVPRIRAQVALSLGNQRDYRALEPLIALLGDGESVVRGAAVNALYDLPDARAIRPLVNILSDDADDDNRHYAARTLGQIGGADVVTALSFLLSADPPPDTKIRAVEVLAAIRDGRAHPALEALRDDPDEDVRATVQWALAQIGDDPT